MLDYIEQMHARGVAHFDLKKKTNLLVTAGDEPCLIDLGVAVIYKAGFHPLNHYLFQLASIFDFNAWVRHKYNNQLQQISDEDRPYYQRTWIESVSYKSKRFYKDKIKRILKGQRPR
jgi:serine/threonine protein kinase